MNELRSLKNNDLHEKIKGLVIQERHLTKIIMEYLAEVDRRKLYLQMAYPSLFDYLTKEIGYSAGAAQRRIDAARLLRQVPEVSEKIENGAINLAQISKLQRACRMSRREGNTITVGEQKEILEKLENKGAEQTDLILAQSFQTEIKTEERRSIQRDESVRIELIFSKNEMALIKKAQDILSHKTGGNLKNTVLEMAQKVVSASLPNIRPPKKPLKITATVAVTPDKLKLQEHKRAPKKLPHKLKKAILNRDRCCQYRDKITGKICGSKRFLEIDHIQPVFAGGGNSVENLRVLCRNHNMYRYQLEQTAN